MTEIDLDFVRGTARQALVMSAGNFDGPFWDRGQRLVRNVEYICQLPELAAAGLQIDRFCLLSAAYFNYVSLAHYQKAENIEGKSVVENTDTAKLLEISYRIVDEQLAGHIENAKIEKIDKIIVESTSHHTKMTEAMILSDARNLDDMGVTGIFNELKQHVTNGKNISDILSSWQKKVDYQYWQARLKESFRFKSVRKIASQRLLTVESFMNQLKIENNAEDLEKLVVETLEKEDEIPTA